MKTIEQQVTVEFHAVEAQNIITMLPVIDRLVSEFRTLCTQFNHAIGETLAEDNTYLLDTAKEAVEKYNQSTCLFNLGFIPSSPFTLQQHEALTIAYYYGLGNEIQDCMQNGISPVDALREFDIL